MLWKAVTHMKNMLKRTYHNLLGVNFEFGLEPLQLVTRKFNCSLANEDILVKFWRFVAKTFRNKLFPKNFSCAYHYRCLVGVFRWNCITAGGTRLICNPFTYFGKT